MSVNPARTHISFDVQAAEIGDGTYNPAAAGVNWVSHKILQGGVGAQEFTDQLPPELGPDLYTGGSFRLGVFGGGAISIHPRLTNSLGTLLYGVSGKYTHTAATTTQSDIGDFEPADDDSTIPLLTARKFIPAAAARAGMYEYTLDSIVTGLALTMPAMGLMRADWSFLGRKPVYEETTTDTPPSLTLEDDAAVATSIGTTVTLGSPLNTIGKFAGAQVIFANNSTRPQDEMVLGSAYPDRFNAVARNVIFRLAYVWKDQAAYKEVMKLQTGGSGLLEWQPTMAITSAQIDYRAPVKVPKPTTGDYDNFYGLKITAPRVEWSMSSPMPTVGQGLRTELLGIVTRGGAYKWRASLENGRSYTFP